MAYRFFDTHLKSFQLLSSPENILRTARGAKSTVHKAQTSGVQVIVIIVTLQTYDKKHHKI